MRKRGSARETVALHEPPYLSAAAAGSDTNGYWIAINELRAVCNALSKALHGYSA